MKMSTTFGFCDLCLNVDTKKKKQLRELFQKLFEMGYSTVAINQTVEESVFETDKKDKKKTGENEATGLTVPNPINVEEFVLEFSGKLRILSRITFVCSDPTRTHTLNQSLNLRKYDLYAIVPTTQAAFQFACSQLSVDIISLNKHCSGIKLSRKLYFQAAEKGIHFEIQYSKLMDGASRKSSIHFSHMFYMYGKSKNVIISSGASNAWDIRSPYDITNLGSILGLNETKAKASILSQSRYLILKAEGRRYGKAIFQIQSSVGEEKGVEMETEENEDSKDCINRKRIKL